ncbi:hypothetical protein SANTM175S_02651 [Streptomyces antimycoticus]
MKKNYPGIKVLGEPPTDWDGRRRRRRSSRPT